MRIKPGELLAAEAPTPDLRVQAEGYVAAKIQSENYREIKSGPELKRVKGVMERLSMAAGYQKDTFPVHLVDAGDYVNAAAFNGASIVVYHELLNKVQSDDELATVLGHEIGHIMAKHYKDQKEEESRASVVNIGSSILGTVASVATSMAGYQGAAGLARRMTKTTTSAVGYGAYVGSFSRTQEYEADHLGLLIMARAGFNPEVAPAFWTRSKEVFGFSQSSAGAFFSTHPAPADRMDELQKALPYAMQQYHPVTIASTAKAKKTAAKTVSTKVQIAKK